MGKGKKEKKRGSNALRPADPQEPVPEGHAPHPEGWRDWDWPDPPFVKGKQRWVMPL